MPLELRQGDSSVALCVRAKQWNARQAHKWPKCMAADLCWKGLLFSTESFLKEKGSRLHLWKGNMQDAVVPWNNPACLSTSSLGQMAHTPVPFRKRSLYGIK